MYNELKSNYESAKNDIEIEKDLREQWHNHYFKLKEEYNELIALKDAITYSPSTVNSEKMEKFAELMVRSLDGKYDPPMTR